MPRVRPADPADLNFILNSFLRSLRGYPALKYVPSDVYYPQQTKVLEGLMRASQILVLCNEEIPDQIYGYIIARPNVETGFVYVKYPYRKFGFGKRLLAEAHPDLYKKTIKAVFTCRNWPEMSAKFRHTHCPYTGAV